MRVPRFDRRTKANRYKELDAEFTYQSRERDRDIVVDSQIRPVICTSKEKRFNEILPDRPIVPKTPVFAKIDLHDDSRPESKMAQGFSCEFAPRIWQSEELQSRIRRNMHCVAQIGGVAA